MCKCARANGNGTKGMAPDSQRKCRDCLFCIVFIVFWCGMIACAAIGFAKGDIFRIVYGTDYRGRVCGRDDGVLDKKYTAYPRVEEDNIINYGVVNPLDFKLFGICVNACPGLEDVVCQEVQSNDGSYRAVVPEDEASRRACFTQDPTPSNCDEVTDNCWITPIDTSSIVFRCIPRYRYNDTYGDSLTCVYPNSNLEPDDPKCLQVAEVQSQKVVRPATPNRLFQQFNEARNQWARYFGDAARAWWVIALCGIGAAVVVSFVWILFLKYCVSVMVALTLILVILLSIALTLFCYYKAGILDPSFLNNFNHEFVDAVRARLEESEENKNNFKWAAYAMTAISVIVLLVIVALRKSIGTAVRVIRMGAQALSAHKSLLIFPFTTVLSLLALLAYSVFVAGLLASAGEITTKDVKSLVAQHMEEIRQELEAKYGEDITFGSMPTLNNTFSSVDNEDIGLYLNIYNFFGFLWTAQFIQGIGILIIAGVIAEWYHARCSKNAELEEGELRAKSRWPVCGSCKRAIRYSMGSVAFGSLLIAIIQFIRAVLAYIHRQMKKSGGNSGTMACFMKCMQCCLAILQKCVEFITRNAYIYIAVKGTSFCVAGGKIFGLFVSNLSDVAVLNLTAEVMMFLGRLTVAAACGFCAFAIVDNMEQFQEGGENELTRIWLIVLLTIISAYLVSAAFFYVIDVATDTIFVSYLIDKTEHNGSPVHIHNSSIRDLKSKSKKEEAIKETEMKKNPVNRT